MHCLSPKWCWELCRCTSDVSPVRICHQDMYIFSRPEHLLSLTRGTAPEVHAYFSWVETTTPPPSHCSYPYLCKTPQTAQEVRDSAAATLQDVHPPIKSHVMLFLSYHLFLAFVQMRSDAGTGDEPEYKSTHKERPQKQASGRGSNQLIRGFPNYS